MLGICSVPLVASAHPLGNFTINHLTEAHFHRDSVVVRYVLDQAEIPTYQTMREIPPEGTFDQAQLQLWARTTAAQSIPKLRVTVAGTSVPLILQNAQARTRPGAGGLPTLYLVATAVGRFPAVQQPASFTLFDQTYAGRLGWHDVIVFPQTEPTKELTAYPSALLGSPRATTRLSGSFDASGIAKTAYRADSEPAQNASANVLSGVPESLVRSNQLSDMIARGTGDITFVLFTFLVAIVLGALHALEPGHGKTLLAISLVGARATVKQAAILAFALTIAHTIGVLALGLALNLCKGYFVPEDIYPWITLVSGVVIAIIGARGLARELRKRAGYGHTHSHVHAHAHDHEHPHEHGAAHHHHHDDMDDAEHAMLHAIPGHAPLKFGPTVWAAMSGGVAPCPAALVVLLAAVALNQIAYGIFVIIAFSFGLAATLTALGIAVVRGAGWLQGRPQFDRFLHYAPIVSAIVIASIGSVMVGQGFVEKGVSAPPLAITAIVILAITGYVFSHPMAHRHAEFQ